MHIFDFRWDQEKESPYFEIIEKNGLQKKFLKINAPFSLSITRSNPHCVGAMVKKEHKPCPHKNTGQKKCEICKKAEDYFPCQFCNGFNCNRFRDEKIPNCDADHMVYLALFDKDLVKVGVSGLSRGKARQYEQGSHFTRVLAKGMSGVMARRIETTLIRAGFPDKVPASKKKNILFPEISLSEGEKILEEKFQFAEDQVISLMPEMKKYLVGVSTSTGSASEEKNFWDMRDYYKKISEEIQEKFPLPIHILSLEEGESVGGDLVMVKGAFLVINTRTELAVILAKDLVGKDISFEDCETGITKNGGFQGGFF